jgi:hypothetical protein
MAVRQCQIGPKMVCANRLADREIGDGRIDMRDKVELPRPDPRPFHDNIDEAIGDQLTNFRAAIDAPGMSLRLTWVLESVAVVRSPLPAMLSCYVCATKLTSWPRNRHGITMPDSVYLPKPELSGILIHS